MGIYGLGYNPVKLIIPVAHPLLANKDNFTHLYSFFNDESLRVHHMEFCQRIGETVQAHLDSGKDLWLETEGTAVGWLHMRLDWGPKYYASSSQYYKPGGLPNM